MRAWKLSVLPLLATIVVSAFITFTPASASAQYVDPDHNVRFKSEKNQFLVAPRIRAITVPGWLLDFWYQHHASHWDGRSNLAYGLEFVWRKVGDYEVSTALDYADLSMPSGLWQESGSNPASPDFTEVNLKLLSLVVSGYWYWDVQKWFSPYVGGGIGAGLVMGDIVRYDPVGGSGCTLSNGFAPNQCFGPNGDPNPDAVDLSSRRVEGSIPPVVPVINLSGGMRFNIGKYGVAKLEVGFYDYFFAGLSLGGQW